MAKSKYDHRHMKSFNRPKIRLRIKSVWRNVGGGGKHPTLSQNYKYLCIQGTELYSKKRIADGTDDKVITETQRSCFKVKSMRLVRTTNSPPSPTPRRAEVCNL